MSKIKVMDEILANKIAAGEVIERCVSIVKELVENSIDAKSNMIKIELIDSGVTMIKVVDDGIGMDYEDAHLAFLRHATSKLLSDDDLFNIKSLGFRGEALPSIASVSEVSLKTCQKDIGTHLVVKGGKIITDEYAGRDGKSQSLADADQLANAVVTGGNANELITLPPMDKVIGYPEVADVIAGGFDGSLQPDGSIVAELQVITGSTNEIGFNKLSAR